MISFQCGYVMYRTMPIIASATSRDPIFLASVLFILMLLPPSPGDRPNRFLHLFGFHDHSFFIVCTRSRVMFRSGLLYLPQKEMARDLSHSLWVVLFLSVEESQLFPERFELQRHHRRTGFSLCCSMIVQMIKYQL